MSRNSVVAAFLLTQCFACGQDAEPAGLPAQTADAGHSQPISTAKSSASVSELPAQPVCEIPHVINSGEAAPFHELHARVLDGEGQPVPNTVAQACGIDVCLPGQTNVKGLISITEDQPIKNVAFKYGDGLLFAQFALPLLGGATHELGDQLTVAFPPIAGAEAFQPGNTAVSTLVSSGAELTLEAGTSVDIDTLTFEDDSQHVFLARPFTADQIPEAAKQEPAFEALWALGPLKTKFCPPAALSLPNLTQLPAGANVEFLLHITDSGGAFGVYGSFARVATGSVSADGQRIVTAAGVGIPQLGVVGIRQLP